jgi:hypothetical protein
VHSAGKEKPSVADLKAAQMMSLKARQETKAVKGNRKSRQQKVPKPQNYQSLFNKVTEASRTQQTQMPFQKGSFKSNPEPERLKGQNIKRELLNDLIAKKMSEFEGGSREEEQKPLINPLSHRMNLQRKVEDKQQASSSLSSSL